MAHEQGTELSVFQDSIGVCQIVVAFFQPTGRRLHRVWSTGPLLPLIYYLYSSPPPPPAHPCLLTLLQSSWSPAGPESPIWKVISVGLGFALALFHYFLQISIKYNILSEAFPNY